MPWESKTVEKLREEFVLAASEKRNFSALCREFGISRKTGYKWIKRDSEGLPLSDQSRRPAYTSNRTPDEIEQLILALRDENPGWGARTIKTVLDRAGYLGIPCVKTVNNILKRNNRISLEESLKHQSVQRFEREHCNELWQTDFKGEFLMNDGKYCYPLDIIDDSSRFLICIKPSLSTANVVIPCFEAVFREYGLPDAILSDNGAQFAGFRQGYTQFEKWLMQLDVLPIHGRVKHPQTQGKIERFHRTLKSELLSQKKFENIDDANRQIQEWRTKYNHVRPHEALGMKCPGEVYVPSLKSYPEKKSVYEYSGQYHVIKVNSWGYVRFDGQRIYLSETMVNEFVEFRPNPHGDSFIVCYRNFKIAEFSSIDGKLINRKISRLH